MSVCLPPFLPAPAGLVQQKGIPAQTFCSHGCCIPCPLQGSLRPNSIDIDTLFPSTKPAYQAMDTIGVISFILLITLILAQRLFPKKCNGNMQKTSLAISLAFLSSRTIFTLFGTLRNIVYVPNRKRDFEKQLALRVTGVLYDVWCVCGDIMVFGPIV